MSTIHSRGRLPPRRSVGLNDSTLDVSKSAKIPFIPCHRASLCTQLEMVIIVDHGLQSGLVAIWTCCNLDLLLTGSSTYWPERGAAPAGPRAAEACSGSWIALAGLPVLNSIQDLDDVREGGIGVERELSSPSTVPPTRHPELDSGSIPPTIPPRRRLDGFLL